MMADRSPDMVDVVYLTELMNDRAQLEAFPRRFKHVERLVDQEIVSVRHRLFDCNFGIDKMQLPEPIGDPVLVREKMYIPDFPEGGRHFNFVGRLLGPRGKTLKSIEQETGCKIMIRGIGSTRPSPPGSFQTGELYSLQSTQQFNQMFYSTPQPQRYTQNVEMLSPQSQQSNQMFWSPQTQPFNQSPPLFAHNNSFFHKQSDDEENDRLHVVIQCEDAPNRAQVRVKTARNLIERLFKPVDEEHDELKRKQLLELALLKGTYKSPRRNSPRHSAQFATPQKTDLAKDLFKDYPSPSPCDSVNSFFMF